MLFSSSKCPLPALVAWCRVLKHSLGAGLDPLRIFRQQAKSGPRPLRGVAADLVARIEQGDSLEDALEPYRDRFPPLFVELVAVGEKAGRLEDTFRELENYYETTLRVQRDFRSQMAYPAIQFVAATGVIALLIFIVGFMNLKIDPTGTGLAGGVGAVIFLVVVYIPVLAALLLLKLSADSVKLRARLEGLVLWVPTWGPALLDFALHRFSIALRMTTEAALRADKVLHYSFRATANTAFWRGEARAVAVAKKGGELHEALRASGAPFPEEFIETVLVAEEAGEVSEVMERVAENYRTEGARKLKNAAQVTGWAVYALVAFLIILAIFKIAGTYLNALNAAGAGM
ncbi:MAG: type II secretion system F family protein [Gemmataceae bacterium]|nr:type II secretion system F family protein [Gemmataceae bacterium]